MFTFDDLHFHCCGNDKISREERMSTQRLKESHYSKLQELNKNTHKKIPVLKEGSVKAEHHKSAAASIHTDVPLSIKLITHLVRLLELNYR